MSHTMTLRMLVSSTPKVCSMDMSDFSRIVDVAPDHIPQLVIIDPAEPLDLFHRHAL